VSHWTSVF